MRSKDLKHFGIPGMRWGHRKAKADRVSAYNRAADRMNSGEIDRINNKSDYKGKKLNADPVLLKKYNDEMDGLFGKIYDEEFRKTDTGRKEAIASSRKQIIDKANKILNDPNASQKDLDEAHASIGINPKTGRTMKTKPVYDKDGNDVSVNPERRFGKKKGQSDKDFDAEVDKEMGLDPDRNPTPANLERRRIQDLQLDNAARKQTVGMLATVGVILVAKHIALNQIRKKADAAILEKYGPALAEMLIKGRG